jgi:hypothetical protein
MKLTLSPVEVTETFVSFYVIVNSPTRKNRLAGTLGFTMEEFKEFRAIVKGATKRKGFELELHPDIAAIK